MRRIHSRWVLTLSVLAALAAFIMGIRFGTVAIPLPTILRIFSGWFSGRGMDTADPFFTIITQIRLPRTLLSALVGAALAAGGVCFQAVLRNPLADPFIIGVSAGAGLGAAMGMAFGIGSTLLGAVALPGVAFVGALAATGSVYILSMWKAQVSVGRLLLAGVAVSSLLTAVMSLLIVWRQQDMQKLVFWLMGGFSGRTWTHVYAALPYVLPGLTGACLLAGRLNLISLGEEHAFHIGLDVEGTKRLALGLGALLAAAAVAVSGVIGFVGLMIPHIVRLLVGPDHRRLFPSTILMGAAFVMAVDTASRTILPPQELPIGILTALCGTPFFLWLLRKRGREL